MEKFYAVLNLFKQGQAVANPALWKTHQITVTALSAVILAVVNTAAVFGVALPVTPDIANAVAAGVLAVVNLVLTVITSDKVGIKANEDEAQ